jgi:hypothetical protein
MRRRHKIIVIIVVPILSMVAFVGYFAYNVVYTVRHIPEAYAAWDTGTLLVEYMQRHNDRWPSSWDDLLTVMDEKSRDQIMLRGSRAGDVEYAQSLRKMVSVDWTFDPGREQERLPVTRPDGSAFRTVWEGAEPNEMVHVYLEARKTSNPRPSTQRPTRSK